MSQFTCAGNRHVYDGMSRASHCHCGRVVNAWWLHDQPWWVRTLFRLGIHR